MTKIPLFSTAPMAAQSISRAHRKLDLLLVRQAQLPIQGQLPLSIRTFCNQYVEDVRTTASLFGGKSSQTERARTFVFGTKGTTYWAHDKIYVPAASNRERTRGFVQATKDQAIDHIRCNGLPAAVELALHVSLVGVAAATFGALGGAFSFLRGRHQDSRLVMALFGLYGLTTSFFAGLPALVGLGVGTVAGVATQQYCPPTLQGLPDIKQSALDWACAAGFVGFHVAYYASIAYANASAALGLGVRGLVLGGGCLVGALLYAPVHTLFSVSGHASLVGAYYILRGSSYLSATLHGGVAQNFASWADKLYVNSQPSVKI